ncbi:hypothetical protein ACYOEI_38785 [Singulisphaera rosea]
MNASDTEPCKRLIEGYGLKLANHADITEEILKMMHGRGEEWHWVETWRVQDAPKWTNRPETFVFEVPPGLLGDRQALDFAQDVWMLQAADLRTSVLGRTDVREDVVGAEMSGAPARCNPPQIIKY